MKKEVFLLYINLPSKLFNVKNTNKKNLNYSS